jgi:pilus assembly protein Flp/PilA
MTRSVPSSRDAARPVVRRRATALFADCRGVTAIEYGLIAGLIAVVIIGVVTTIGSDLTNIFNAVSGGLQNAGSF